MNPEAYLSTRMQSVRDAATADPHQKISVSNSFPLLLVDWSFTQVMNFRPLWQATSLVKSHFAIAAIIFLAKIRRLLSAAQQTNRTVSHALLSKMEVHGSLTSLQEIQYRTCLSVCKNVRAE
jgi:hypothetical protein